MRTRQERRGRGDLREEVLEGRVGRVRVQSSHGDGVRDGGRLDREEVRSSIWQSQRGSLTISSLVLGVEG